MDNLTKEQRSFNMSRIKAEDTKPEMIVRRLLFKSGLRYRLHSGRLPGRPDIVLKKLRTVIFVHGCFWHNHQGCSRGNIPKSNMSYWLPKINKNKERDRKVISELQNLGWRVIVIWECETNDLENLLFKLSDVLKSDYVFS